MNNEMSIEHFIETIKKLPKHEHREAWIRWLSDYDKAGPFKRQTGEKHSAKFVYNNLAFPEMLLWLIQSVGIEQGLIDMAESDSKQFENVRRKAAAIRKRVPWKDLERLLKE